MAAVRGLFEIERRGEAGERLVATIRLEHFKGGKTIKQLCDRHNMMSSSVERILEGVSYPWVEGMTRVVMKAALRKKMTNATAVEKHAMVCEIYDMPLGKAKTRYVKNPAKVFK